MNMKRILQATPLALLLLPDLSIAQTPETPFFIALPPDVLPYDVGANGWVSVGVLLNGGGIYWMPSTGTVPLGGTQAKAISRDGKTILGNALDSQGRENAAIWISGTSWRLLGSFTPGAERCDRSYSSTYGASEDGRVIVGLAWDGCKFARAFRWEESTGMVNLGSLDGSSSRANQVSGDGHVVVGWDQALTGFRRGAKWVNGAEQLIKGPTGGMVGEAFAANHDGSIIVGMNCTPDRVSGSPAAWVWRTDTGIQCFPVDLPRWLPPLPYQAIMEATSDDGSVIGGAYSFGLDSEALIWLDGKSYFLKDYLQQNGLPNAFRGWVNTGFITGVTADGRTLVGYGAGPTTFQGYMVVLPDRGKR